MKKPGTQALQVLLLMALRHTPVWEEQQWISARSQAPIITGKKMPSVVRFYRKSVVYRGSYFERIQQLMD